MQGKGFLKHDTSGTQGNWRYYNKHALRKIKNKIHAKLEVNYYYDKSIYRQLTLLFRRRKTEVAIQVVSSRLIK